MSHTYYTNSKRTKEQSEIDYAIDQMKKDADNYIIRSHMNIKGKRMYRLVDPKFNPVINLDYEATREALKEGRLITVEGMNGTFKLNKNYNNGALRLSRDVSS